MAKGPTAKESSASQVPALVFALSITEEIEWAFLQIKNTGTPQRQRIEATTVEESGIWLDFPRGNIDSVEFNEKDPLEIQPIIHEYLLSIKRQYRHYFDRTIAIGVSIIGFVDDENNKLMSLRRKNWKAWGKNDCLIDFEQLFFETSDSIIEPLFDKCKIRDLVKTSNDCSARALSEIRFNRQFYYNKKALFFIAGEGVNGAFVRAGDTSIDRTIEDYFVARSLHSEMGHMSCTPFVCDDFLDEFAFNALKMERTGCPMHQSCFEGLATNFRVRVSKRFGKIQRVCDLSPVEPNQWRELEIVAGYLAQLAFSGYVTVGPSVIVFSGEHFSGATGEHLIKRIRQHLLSLNNGYLPTINEDSVESLVIKAFRKERLKLESAIAIAAHATLEG